MISDPRGELPKFLREPHRLTAKAMNASRFLRCSLFPFLFPAVQTS